MVVLMLQYSMTSTLLSPIGAESCAIRDISGGVIDGSPDCGVRRNSQIGVEIRRFRVRSGDGVRGEEATGSRGSGRCWPGSPAEPIGVLVIWLIVNDPGPRRLLTKSQFHE